MKRFFSQSKTLPSQRIVILLFSCTIIGMLSSCGMEMPKSKPAILKAEAENLGPALSIKNLNGIAWSNVVITLNDKYSCPSVGSVPAGETVTIDYSEFKDPAGNPFPPGTQPKKYFIDADEGTGPV